MALVAICRMGSSYNYFFEPMTHLTSLTIVVMAWCMEKGGGGLKAITRLAVGAVALWGAAVAGLTLIYPQGLGPRLRWNLAKCFSKGATEVVDSKRDERAK